MVKYSLLQMCVKVARVTGEALPGESIYNPNNTGSDFDVYGSDLGIMWHTRKNQVGLFLVIPVGRALL